MLRKIISGTVLIMLVMSLLTVVFHAYKTWGEPETTIYLDPSNFVFNITDTSIGKLFNASVWVRNVTDLCVYQIQIRYNATVLDCIDVIEPTWDQYYVLHSILPYTMTTEKDEVGKYTIGGSELPTKPAAHFNGTGLITIFTFNITRAPTKAGNLTSALNINNSETFLLDRYGTKISGVTKEDGYYEIDWLAPPKPKIAISPTDQYFDAYSNHIGEKFNETVLIKGLDLAWGLTNASFCLCYNTTLINVTRYWIDPPWQNSVVTYTAGTWDELNVTVWDSTETPSGDVELIVIEFVVVYQGMSPPRPDFSYDETPLFFSSHALCDHTFQIPEDTPIEGKVRIDCMLVPQFHDIAIEDIWTSKTILCQGYGANITVAVKNKGDFAETFNVTVYANTTSIATQIVTLPRGNSTTVIFTWNASGFAKAYYVISANATQVLGETNTTNNALTNGQVKVVIPGDVNGDGIVNMVDIYTELILRYMCKLGDPGYAANSDITNDGVINYQDIYIAILHFMETDP